MKRVLLICFAVISVFTSCQKGEEDPVFSLVGRKARLSGTWNLVNFSARLNETSRSFESGEMTYVVGDTFEYSRPFIGEYTFDRDGNYTITQTEDFPEDTLLGTVAYSKTTIESGIWEFTGGNGSPSKSKLLLMKSEVKITRSDQSSNLNVTTYEDVNQGSIYNIVGLSSEDLKLKFDQVISFGGGQNLNSEELILKKV